MAKASKPKRRKGQLELRDQRRLQHLAVLSGIVLAGKLLVMISIPGGAWLGADGENYLGHVELLWKNGIFSEGLMYWPAGYPLLLALLSLPGHGAMLWLMSIVQTAAWSGAVWMLSRQLLRTPIGWAALPVAYLALLNPTLSLSSLVVGYESPTAAIHVVALALLLRDLSQEPEARRPHEMLIAAGLLGLASFMQPRLIVGACLLLAVWWVARGRTRAGAALAVGALIIVAAFPAALMARNQVANGVATISTNLGATMMIGAGEDASGSYTNEASGVPCTITATTEQAIDSQKVRCVVSWYVQHPGQAVRLAAAKTVHFWSPWYGPLGQGTMARNPWLRIHPVKASVTSQAGADVVYGMPGKAVSWLWLVGGWVLLAAGTLGLWRAKGRLRALGLAASGIVASSWLISLGTIGDHRFRLPIMGASLLLQVIGWRMLVARQAQLSLERTVEA